MFENDDLYREKFICFNKKDMIKSLNEDELHSLYTILDKIAENNGNKKYLCINQDEPYAEKVWEIVKEAETKEIVAFVGNAGSGKDYQCDLLVKRGYQHAAFADALRNIAFSCLDIEGYIHEYDYLKKNECITITHENGNETKITFRKLLERLGTEGIRKYDNDFWCKALVKTIKDNNYKKVCISDMRFYNEYKWLKQFAEENGYKFKVIFCDYHSDRYDYNNPHVSARLANYFVDNGYKDLQELTDKDFREFLGQMDE